MQACRKRESVASGKQREKEASLSLAAFVFAHFACGLLCPCSDAPGSSFLLSVSGRQD